MFSATSTGNTAGQPALTLIGAQGGPDVIDMRAIPGFVTAQVAVNAIASSSAAQVAVGSADGLPAAWVSTNGGSTWTRGTGTPTAALTQPGERRAHRCRLWSRWLGGGRRRPRCHAAGPSGALRGAARGHRVGHRAGLDGGKRRDRVHRLRPGGDRSRRGGTRRVRDRRVRHHGQPQGRGGLVLGGPDRLAARPGRAGGRARRRREPADERGDGDNGRIRGGRLRRAPPGGLAVVDRPLLDAGDAAAARFGGPGGTRLRGRQRRHRSRDRN